MTQIEQTSLVDRLLGKKGPVVLSEGERVELHAAFLGVNQRCRELARMVDSVGDALRWNSLRVVHTKRDGGGTGYDLAAALNDDDATVS